MFLLPNQPKIKCKTNIKSLFDTTTNPTKDLRLRVAIAQLLQMDKNQEICAKLVEQKNQRLPHKNRCIIKQAN